MPPTGLDPTLRKRLEEVAKAVNWALWRIYRVNPRTRKIQIRERNRLIRARFKAGATQTELASQYGISVQRIHQIVHLKRK